ncbi:hypothetical protein LTR96_010995 [Exophiala xenobiotica]|nr:hypothetical protein LTR41_011114 [Exophiala xenobiotica]KAK5215901.1 hypothetical protein LTR72_011073 [Exophiala xenobiotica]KAK5219337.1 hypothetical protein LTR47_011514 [Exophiala xenobiotica]KAK5245927.1 hypothetical protein LTS06_008709 [Exophiala xenobiotica]KAK5261505.1 hypothetical protein LTR40_002091 [Exophiala xenobiotica]
MIHAGCKHHHCRKHTEIAESLPTFVRHTAELSPPEFLHCGAWPPPHEPANNEANEVPKSAPSQGEQVVEAYPPYTPLPDIDENGSPSQESTGSEEVSGGSDDEIHIAPPKTADLTWEELSTAVSTWKISADESRPENEIETSRKPYSVLKLLARHDGNGRRGTKGPTKKSPRQNLFDQEIAAEGQARVEITEYIDRLVDNAEYEEAYACVWPLEDYRREGWAKEMVAAYPIECAVFVEKCAVFVENVNENSRGRLRERQESES